MKDIEAEDADDSFGEEEQDAISGLLSGIIKLNGETVLRSD